MDKLNHLLLKTTIKQNFIILLLISIFVGTIAVKFPFLSWIAITGFALMFLTFTFPSEVFFIFLFLLFSLGDYFGAFPIVIGGFNFYGADYFLVLLIILLIKKKNFRIKTPISTLLIVYIIYGFFCMINGYFYHNYELNRTIGEFRRFFYYPLSFFLGLNIIRENKDIRKLEKIMPFIPIVIMIFALRRILTGISWSPDIHKTPQDFRAMAYYDGVGLLFIFSYFISIFFIKKKLNLFKIIIPILIPVFIIFSGFRLLWALLFLSLIIPIWWTFKLGKVTKRYVRYLFYALIIIFISLMVFKLAGGKYYEIMKEKFVENILHYEGFKEGWRYFAWSNALSKFSSSPIFGIGLGEDPTFWIISSTGKWFQTTHPPHNAFIEILYQTGSIGALLFLLIIFKYGIYVYKNSRKINEDVQPIVIALFVLFICGLIQSLFQPYLNHPGNGVIFFSAMGIAIRLIQISKKSNKKFVNK
ncbi:MAG: O-antigen ligase family protein [Candidatus Aminicenantia bacterium]